MKEMIFSLLKANKRTQKVYSRVVSDSDTKVVTDLLRQAAKQANADQRELVK